MGEKLKKLIGLPVDSDGVSIECNGGIKKYPLLSEAWKGFVSWKSWGDKRAKDNQSVFDNLVYFLGDIPVGDVSKADLKACSGQVKLATTL